MTPSFDACTQLSLDLFPSPTFESILDSRQIRGMSVTVSNRLRRGWYAKRNPGAGTCSLVVPSYLENAPEEVKTALIDWALLSGKSRMRRGRTAYAPLKKELELLVYRHIESSGMAFPKRVRFDPRSLRTQGCLWDLSEVFDSLNRTYFNDTLSSHVRWGKSMVRSYQSCLYDEKGVRRSLITIGAMYDRPGVPRFAVEGIMFHEMLHIAVPPVRRRCRNVVHGADFKKRERQFPWHAQWLAWEKTALIRTAGKD
jgi:hypothetical protein